MKKNLFLGALAVLSMTACSQDEVVDVNQHGNEIQFSVVANKGTRAADLFCNKDLPGSFKAWAAVNDGSNTNYFAGEVFTPKGDGSGTWVTQALHYWPEVDHLNFYAVAGADVNIDVTAAGAALNAAYEVKADPAAQEDLLYSASLDKANPLGTNTTPLNFRHALAQIVFKGKTTNPNLYVEVSEVRVANVQGKGTFAWNKDTGVNFKSHDGEHADDTDVAEVEQTAGEWTLDGALYGYTSKLAAPVAMPNSDTQVYNWTDGNKELTMLLAPQQANKWAVGNATGSFIAVKCAMYHVAEPAKGLQASDVPVWASQAQHKWVIIPADLAWKPGKKYIYTICFGTGDGGYKPDPTDPDPTDPTPDPDQPEVVLTPVTFTVSVDDFDLVYDEVTDATTK